MCSVTSQETEEGSADDAAAPGGSVQDEESLYEPPDADESPEYVSPAWTDGSDLSSSTVSPLTDGQ